MKYGVTYIPWSMLTRIRESAEDERDPSRAPEDSCYTNQNKKRDDNPLGRSR